MHNLISKYIAPRFDIKTLTDAAALDIRDSGRIAFTTDSYVVSPIFFPGGDIGDLAVNGTVNDLSVSGAKPLYLSSGFIIEEGFLISDLERILISMSSAAQRAGVRIVAGDTKVVERGKGDGIFINTSGIGVIPNPIEMSASNIKAADKIIISGKVGSHGTAIIAQRNGLKFEPQLLSDTRPLNAITEAMLSVCPNIRIMRDPTRGGLATTLKEFSEDSGMCMTVYEDYIPIEPRARGACELMGLDPLYAANEGVVLAVVPPDMAQYIVDIMRKIEGSEDACIIGDVQEEPHGMSVLKTTFGGSRILDMLPGEQLPRIC